MARPITVSITGTGSSPWAVIDHHLNPFQIGLAAVVSGTVNYTVQHTFDNVIGTGSATTVFPHSSLAAQTATGEGAYVTPVTAIRVTNNSGTGTTTLTIQQAGIHS